MDTATAKRNALLQRRTPSGRNNNTRTTARVTRPAPVTAPPPPEDDDEQEELPQAFGKGIQNNENDKDSEEEENERNGESVDDEEDDPYSPLNGPSPSPAPPRYDDPQQLLRRNNNNNPKTAIRAGAIERPKSIAITHQQKLQQQKQPPPTSIASQPPLAPSGGSSSSYLDEYIFKVCVVGNHNVGKTSLVRRMCNPIIPSSSSADAEQILHTRPTIGVDFSSRVVENIRPGALVRMQLWDTAGLEKFAAVSAPVYRNCAGVIAVVDVLNKDTLDALVTKWLPAVLGQLPTLPLSSVLVLCNKMDLLEAFTTTTIANTDDATSTTSKKNGHVALPQGVDPSKFTNAGEVAQVLSNAGINDTLIMEVSAKSGLNVEDAISLLCNRIIDKIAATTTTSDNGDLGAASGNRNGNGGGGGDGAEAKSPGKPPPKSRKEEEVKKTSRGGGGGRNSDDDEDDDSASPRESNTDISNKYPTTTTKNTATGGGTGRSQIVNLQDAKKSEPLEASTSSSVRSKKSNATYCPC